METDERPGWICPALSTPMSISGDAWGGGSMQKCRAEECAWWLPERERCAIAHIAHTMDAILVAVLGCSRARHGEQ
jgi:hypothetical protein